MLVLVSAGVGGFVGYFFWGLRKSVKDGPWLDMGDLSRYEHF